MNRSRSSLALVVAAAGYGVRLDSGLPKQYVPLLGIPIVQRTLSTLGGCDAVDAIVVAVNPQDVEYCQEEIRLEHIPKVVKVASGGEERALSVRNGLYALAELGTWDLVGVHDAARPLIACEEIGRAVTALENDPTLDGVVLAVPTTDTIKIVDENRLIKSTLDRRPLWCAQTPQVFRWQVLMDAYEVSDMVLRATTDDASLVEARGGRVAIVDGSPENFKITNRIDLRHAEHILAARRR